MPRNVIVIVVLLFTAGAVAAFIRAQDSARRKPTAFIRISDGDGPTGNEPGRLPTGASGGNYVALPAAAEEEAVAAPSSRRRSAPPVAAAPADSAEVPPEAAAETTPYSPEVGSDVAAPPTDTSNEQRSVLKKLPSMNGPSPSVETPQTAPAPLKSPVNLAPIAPSEAVAAPLESVPSNVPSSAPAGVGSSRRKHTAPVAKPQNRPAKDTAEGPSLNDHQVVSRLPALELEMIGPAAITVGKAAKYEVRIFNAGQEAARDVVARMPVPSWVNVVSSRATLGDAQMSADAQGAPRLAWAIPELKAGGEAVLRLQLIAGEGQPFDLTAEWACRPVAARVQVAVRQPQLELSLSGPADILLGEEKTFALTVTNSGTGDATGVVVAVVPGPNRPQQIEVGLIKAGETREIPIQVVANQAGHLELRAIATGDGQLKAEAVTKLLVRQPELTVAVDGEPIKFAGGEATYTITVANKGNAVADDVSLTVGLPTGAKYISGVDNAEVVNGNLKWKSANIAPGAERVFEVRIQLNTEGANRLVAQAQDKTGTGASGEVTTEVEAVSNLKLVVNDPAGPLPTGGEATYELQVMNRGSRAAKKVKILMQFGEGIEPLELQGGQGKIVTGQVLLDTLPELGAGEQVTLHIKAKAEKAGAKQYRVEVTSAEGDARLVTEGTTRFFQDGGRGAAARTARKPAPSGPTPAKTMR